MEIKQREKVEPTLATHTHVLFDKPSRFRPSVHLWALVSVRLRIRSPNWQHNDQQSPIAPTRQAKAS